MILIHWQHLVLTKQCMNLLKVLIQKIQIFVLNSSRNHLTISKEIFLSSLQLARQNKWSRWKMKWIKWDFNSKVCKVKNQQVKNVKLITKFQKGNKLAKNYANKVTVKNFKIFMKKSNLFIIFGIKIKRIPATNNLSAGWIGLT